MHNQTTEHNLMLEFEHSIADIKRNPERWYLYSTRAYEVIYGLETSGDSYTDHMRQTLDLALDRIGVKLGCIGQDSYGRNIIVDYYGTSLETTLISLDYASKKQVQYRRIRANLSRRYQNTQNELDKLNRRIHRYTYDTSKNYLVALNRALVKRHTIEHRLDRISKRQELISIAYARLQQELQIEFYRLFHL